MSDPQSTVQFIASVVVEESMIPKAGDVPQMLDTLRSHEGDIKSFKKFTEEWKNRPSIDKWWNADDARDNMLRAIAISGELTVIANKLAVMNVVFAQIINKQTQEVKANTVEIKSNCLNIQENGEEIRRFQQKAEDLSDKIIEAHKDFEVGLEKLTSRHVDLRNEFEDRKKTIIRSIAEIHLDITHLHESDEQFKSQLAPLQNRIENITKRIEASNEEGLTRLEALRGKISEELANNLQTANQHAESIQLLSRDVNGFREYALQLDVFLNGIKNQVEKVLERLDISDGENVARVDALRDVSDKTETCKQTVIDHAKLIQVFRFRQQLSFYFSVAALGMSILALALIFLK